MQWRLRIGNIIRKSQIWFPFWKIHTLAFIGKKVQFNTENTKTFTALGWSLTLVPSSSRWNFVDWNGLILKFYSHIQSFNLFEVYIIGDKLLSSQFVTLLESWKLLKFNFLLVFLLEKSERRFHTGVSSHPLEGGGLWRRVNLNSACKLEGYGISLNSLPYSSLKKVNTFFWSKTFPTVAVYPEQ